MCPPRSSAAGSLTAGLGFGVRPDPAELPARPPAPDCLPETPAAPPERHDNCRYANIYNNHVTSHLEQWRHIHHINYAMQIDTQTATKS